MCIKYLEPSTYHYYVKVNNIISDKNILEIWKKLLGT